MAVPQGPGLAGLGALRLHMPPTDGIKVSGVNKEASPFNRKIEITVTYSKRLDPSHPIR